MAKKIHWSGLGGGSLRCAASRSRGLHIVMHRPCEAKNFVLLSKDSPDLYCIPCATKARLALAAESAPKPDAVVWPKPRPIEEYTGNDPFLGLCKHHGWLTVRPERSKSGNCILGWLTCCPSAAYVIPTHFLPLPPEVR